MIKLTFPVARISSAPFGVLLGVVFSGIAHAQESAPDASGRPPVETLQAPVNESVLSERILCDGLPYNDRGVPMVPLRPVCDFLRATTTYQDALLTLVKNFDGGALRTVTLRLGGKSAQVWDGAAPRTVALARPAESRLGVIFIPAKFLIEILGGGLELNASKVPVRVLDGNRTGTFMSHGQQKYSGADAVKVTLANRVGKAMSLRLNGPQKLRVEIGQGSTQYLQLKPGVYYFQAGSAGMQAIKGTRRLLAGRKTSWTWGRHK